MEIFQKSFNVTVFSLSKRVFFFLSVVKIIKNSCEMFFFSRKVKLGFTIETALYNNFWFLQLIFGNSEIICLI